MERSSLESNIEEINRLNDFILRLANKIFLAHEVLAQLAERKVDATPRRRSGSKRWSREQKRWVPLYFAPT